MSDEGKSGFEERRSAQRLAVDLWVEESNDRELYFQRGANISSGGIYLERTIPHAKGTVINLQFSLPGGGKPIKVSGEIVNVGDEATELGMGVRFVDLDDEDKSRIDEYIRKASSDSDEE